MQKFVPYLFVLLLAAGIAACGGSTSTTAATPIYAELPAPLAPANTLMGGAVQGGAISAKFSNYSVSTFTGVAGSAGFSDYSTTNGPPARFNQLNDITTDGINFYVADFAKNVIRKVTPLGEVRTISNPVTGFPVGVNRPSGITTDGTNLYVVAYGSNTINIIDIASGAVTTIGSTTGLAGSVDVKVVAPATAADATLARFNQPTGITTDGVYLYVTDSGNHTVRRIEIATKAVSTVAGTSGIAGSTNGIQRVARFNIPNRITTDGTSLFLTDFGNRTIRKIDIASGLVTTLAGAPGPLGKDNGTADSTDGTGATARFYHPNGITTDGTNLYVTDSYQNTIRKADKVSGKVVTIAGIPGTPQAAGGAVDSPGIPSFSGPIGITTDGASLFVADTRNHTIRKIK